MVARLSLCPVQVDDEVADNLDLIAHLGRTDPGLAGARRRRIRELGQPRHSLGWAERRGERGRGVRWDQLGIRRRLFFRLFFRVLLGVLPLFGN